MYYILDVQAASGLDPFQALVLGIVQGLTEFLPISSSAHLILVPWVLGWNGAAINSIQFDVALHMGTLVAVLVYFWTDWVRYVRAWIGSVVTRSIGDDPDRRIAWYLLLASIPAGIVGVLGESKIDALFHEPANLRTGLLIIGAVMFVMAGVLLIAERVGEHRLEMTGLHLNTALIIGFAQALALIPGVSRSGSTITAGLFVGLKREPAARFSFLLATPVILGAGLKKIYDAMQAGGIASDEQLGFVIGFLAAAVSGFFCIYLLLQYLQRHSTAPFIVYRFILGILIIVAVLGFSFHV